MKAQPHDRGRAPDVLKWKNCLASYSVDRRGRMCRCSVPFRERQAAFGWRHRGFVSIAWRWRARQDMEKLAHAACGEPLESPAVYFFGAKTSVVPLAGNAVRASTANVEHGVATVSAWHSAHGVAAPGRVWRLTVSGTQPTHTFRWRALRSCFRVGSSRALVHSTHTDTPATRGSTPTRCCGARGGQVAGPRAARALEHARAHGSPHGAAPGALPGALRLVLVPDEGSGDLGHSSRAHLVAAPRHRCRAISSRAARSRAVGGGDLRHWAAEAPHVVLPGALTACKDVLTLARAARILLDRGVPVHVIS